MTRTLLTAMTAAALIAGAICAAPAVEAVAIKATTFKNCTEMHKRYPGGVARSKQVRNMKTVSGTKVPATSRYKPKISKKLYDANTRLDRDKDGIACEA